MSDQHSTDAFVAEAKRIAEKAQKGRRAFGSAVVLLFVGAVALSAWAVVVNFGQDTVIDRLSACERDPTGGPCQRIKRESDKARNVESACILVRKAGYVCPKPGTEAARRFHRQVVAAPGGEAQNPSNAGQQPVPGNGDTGVKHGEGQGGRESPPTLAPSPSPTSPTASSPVAQEADTGPPTVTGGSPEAIPPVLPDATDEPQGVVEGVTGVVESTLCPVNAAGISVCN